MPRRILIALLLTLPALASCYPCNNIAAMPAFSVAVTSEATGAKVCDATVTGVIGTQIVTLSAQDQSDPQNGRYNDRVGSPAGAYLLVVTAPGFKAASVPVSVEYDMCRGNSTQYLSVALKSQSGQ